MRLNGYEYHVNLVIADLGTVNIILGIDFMLAYDTNISMQLNTVSFHAGTLINTLLEEEGPDHVPVRVGQNCAMQAGHFN